MQNKSFHHSYPYKLSLKSTSVPINRCLPKPFFCDFTFKFQKKDISPKLNSVLIRTRLIVTKKQGNAPTRNKMKRRIRHMFQEISQLKINSQYEEKHIINNKLLLQMICYKEFANKKFSELKTSVIKKLEKKLEISFT